MIHRVRNIFFSLFLFQVGILNAQSFDANLSLKLQQKLDSVRIAYQIKGISAAVFIPNQGFWSGVSGISHANIAITPDMEFGIGSNTKLFTAVSLLKLMENNSSITLNDSISKWLPTINNVNPNITIKQLLNHTSGLADITNFPGYADSILSNPFRVFQPTELFPYIGTPIFQPGNGSYYSNTNYLLAGLIFQSATSQNLPSYLRTNILNPLQLDSTFFDVFEPVSGTIAQPWQNMVNINSSPRTALNSAAWCAGAMYSTATEMAQWYKALLIDKIVLNTSSYNNLINFEPLGNYGLGIGKQIVNSRTVWGHGGDIRGYRSRVMLDTATKAIIVVLTNTNPLDVNAVTAQLLNTITSNLNTSVNEVINDHLPIQVFPNPANNEIQIKNLNELTSYQIYNTGGQLLLYGQTENLIDLKSLPSGLYHCIVSTSKATNSFKILKH